MSDDLFAWDCVFETADELDANFSGRVAFDLVLHKPALHLKLHHLERSTNASVDDAVVAKIGEIGRKLNELCQRVVVEHERELIACCRPVSDRWLDVEIHPESRKVS